MARWQYDNVAIDQQGNALDNIEVTVYEGDTATEATIYTDRVASTPHDNPFITDSTGLIQFFAEIGTYRLEWVDTELPIRIQARTIYVESINADDFAAISSVADTIWAAGDFKESAQTADHSRWLKCDGRALTATEIETELGLDAGEASDLESLLGTGSSSIYGSTTGSKIQIPDFVGFFKLEQSGSHPKKGSGHTGGIETVILTADKIPLKGHSLTGSAGAQSVSGTAAADGDHQHTGIWDGSNNPLWAFLGGYSVGSGTAPIINYGVGGTLRTSFSGNHTHSVSGSTGGGAITINNVVDNNSGVIAHENMPPYKVFGNTFIRV